MYFIPSSLDFLPINMEYLLFEYLNNVLFIVFRKVLPKFVNIIPRYLFFMKLY